MRTTTRLFFIALSLFVVLVAPACGEDEITDTGRDFLGELSESLCESSVSCGNWAPEDYDLCVDLLLQTICEADQETCNTTYTLPRDEWHDCLDASAELDCNALDPLIFPRVCTQIEELF
jgi:hypothetical protein